MSVAQKAKPTGYDKFVDWKLFLIPVVLFFLILALPTPSGMQDVGAEYSVGPRRVIEYFTRQLFHASISDAEQWQLLAAQIMEQNMQMGVMSRARFLKRDVRWCQKYKISAGDANLKKAQAYVQGHLSDAQFALVMQQGLDLRKNRLDYSTLQGGEKQAARKGAWQIQVAIAMVVFVVFCFLTECIPLPGVAFCIGLILVFTGVVGRQEVAMLYWDDAVWFIMGSLMFAAAFVKTGVDKRVCLAIFKRLAVPNVRWITLIFFIVIAPLASFISDHALAAMFLPIGILLYQNSLSGEIPEDTELAKMLMITIAMACNIGGFGAPSGGARNVIMMTYLNDMFGIDIGYFQWVSYGMPFVLCMVPITWLVTTWRFKPRVVSLAPAMIQLEREINKMGPWSRQQIVAVIIFAVMVFGWFTEKAFYDMGLLPIRLGIGVIAIAGAVAYLLTGVVNWRDYQQKVDWGVVWLYAGAIIFGRTLDSTGAAYWMARSAIEGLARIGMDSGIPLLMANNALTAAITNLMADGPAAAAVGPVSLNMAGLAHPGTTFLPFIAMGTACASSFAYCLIIGTPPNAIVYASGYLSPKDFLRVGLIMWIVANLFLMALTVGYWVMRGFGELPAF
ncbi:MAG: DASS family sodium-coupled anion symporter [Desulfatitalea sp.]|nr:DASS family sodium-coupled anion symporter [Desulfatitalea sp.]NNK00064.1 DASS family sodium-coupled anion symporter [Desulfatitalea sp.]